MGASDKIKFWHDVWLEEIPLAHEFFRLFLNSLQKEEVVGNLGGWDRIVGDGI